MTEKVVGTLNEFIEIDPSCYAVSSIKNLPFHKNSYSYRQRVRTSIDQYVASRKKIKSPTNICQSCVQKNLDRQLVSNAVSIAKFENEVKRRQKKCIHKISMFKKDAYFAQLHIKMRPKLDQSILIALNKIKKTEKQQSMESNYHEISFNRRPKFKQIKKVPFMFDSMNKKMQRYIYDSSSLKKSSERKRTISPEKRIEYQQCLNWAKKHRKDSKHYELQLGKLKTQESLIQKSQRRKKLLGEIKNKSKSNIQRYECFH